MVDIKSLMKPKTILRHLLGCRATFQRPMIRFVEAYFCERPVIGAEVGVYNGTHASRMLKYFHYLKRLYLFDPYESYYEYDKEKLDLAKSLALKKLEKYEDTVIWNFVPFEASLIPEKLDFIYIDGNHDYDPVVYDIKEALKIVKPKGIIGGHDYQPADHPLCNRYGVGWAVRSLYSEEMIHYNNGDWWVIHDG